MAISFYIQSKKNPASLYVRIREGVIDAKANTNLKVNQEDFSKGEIKYLKSPNGASANIKKETERDLLRCIFNFFCHFGDIPYT